MGRGRGVLEGGLRRDGLCASSFVVVCRVFCVVFLSLFRVAMLSGAGGLGGRFLGGISLWLWLRKRPGVISLVYKQIQEMELTRTASSQIVHRHPIVIAIYPPKIGPVTNPWIPISF